MCLKNDVVHEEVFCIDFLFATRVGRHVQAALKKAQESRDVAALKFALHQEGTASACMGFVNRTAETQFALNLAFSC